MANTIKIINPWKVHRTTPDYYYFSKNNRVYQNGDFSIFSDPRGFYTHTYKNVAIDQKGKMNKELFHNLKYDLNTNDYFNYQRPKEIIKQYSKFLKKIQKIK